MPTVLGLWTWRQEISVITKLGARLCVCARVVVVYFESERVKERRKRRRLVTGESCRLKGARLATVNGPVVRPSGDRPALATSRPAAAAGKSVPTDAVGYLFVSSLTRSPLRPMSKHDSAVFGPRFLCVCNSGRRGTSK